MTQLEIYKEALNVMREAQDQGRGYWEFGHKFTGLYELVFWVSYSYGLSRAKEACVQLTKDSEKLLGRELRGYDYWFTEIERNEPRARAERIEHLEKLIKLYEDDTGRVL